MQLVAYGVEVTADVPTPAPRYLAIDRSDGKVSWVVYNQISEPLILNQVQVILSALTRIHKYWRCLARRNFALAKCCPINSSQSTL